MRGDRRRLVDLVATDLPEHRLDTDDDGRQRFTPLASGPTIEFEERVERRFLGRTLVGRFRVTIPVPSPPALIDVSHVGRIKRAGIEARVREGTDYAFELATALESDGDVQAAMLPLDFTSFTLESSGRGWVATVELMGATLVSIVFPPMKSYVRLHRDQREALFAAFDAISRVIKSS